jgi:hypothetical protein
LSRYTNFFVRSPSEESNRLFADMRQGWEAEMLPVLPPSLPSLDEGEGDFLLDGEGVKPE